MLYILLDEICFRLDRLHGKRFILRIAYPSRRPQASESHSKMSRKRPADKDTGNIRPSNRNQSSSEAAPQMEYGGLLLNGI